MFGPENKIEHTGHGAGAPHPEPARRTPVRQDDEPLSARIVPFIIQALSAVFEMGQRALEQGDLEGLVLGARRPQGQLRDGKIPSSAMIHCIARNGGRFSCGWLPPAACTMPAFMVTLAAPV